MGRLHLLRLTGLFLLVILVLGEAAPASTTTPPASDEDAPSDSEMSQELEEDWNNPLVDEKEDLKKATPELPSMGGESLTKVASKGSSVSIGVAAAMGGEGTSAEEIFKKDYNDLMGSSDQRDNGAAHSGASSDFSGEEAEEDDDGEGDSDLTHLTGHFQYLMNGLSKKNDAEPPKPHMVHHHARHNLNDILDSLPKPSVHHGSEGSKVEHMLDSSQLSQGGEDDTPELEETDHIIEAQKSSLNLKLLEAKMKEQDKEVDDMQSVTEGDGSVDPRSIKFRTASPGEKPGSEFGGLTGVTQMDEEPADASGLGSIRGGRAKRVYVSSRKGRKGPGHVQSMLGGITAAMTETSVMSKKKKRHKPNTIDPKHEALRPPPKAVAHTGKLTNLGPSKVIDGGAWVESGQIWPNLGGQLFENPGTGNNRREVIIQIPFKHGFQQIPAVHIGFTAWDFPNDADPAKTRTLNVFAKHVSQKGFELVIQTWAKTRIRSAGVSWMAFGTNAQAENRMNMHRYLMNKMMETAIRRQQDFKDQQVRKAEFEKWTKDQHKFAEEKFKWVKQIIQQHKFVENMLRVVRLVRNRVETLGAHYDRTRHVNDRLNKIIPRLNEWAWEQMKIMKAEVKGYISLVKDDIPKQDAGLRWWDHERFREISYEMKEMWFKRRLLNHKMKNLRVLLETVGAKGAKHPDLMGPKKGVFCHCKSDPTELDEPPSAGVKAASSLLAHHVNADAANPENNYPYEEELLQTEAKTTYSSKVCVCQGQGGVSVDGFEFPKKFML